MFSNLILIAAASGVIGALMWIVLDARYSKLESELLIWSYQVITTIMPMIALLPMTYKALVLHRTAYLIAGGVGSLFWIVSLTLTYYEANEGGIHEKEVRATFIAACLIGLIATIVAAWSNGL